MKNNFFILILILIFTLRSDFSMSEELEINSKKIKNELNWEPKETFSSGIEKTVSWYIKNIDWLNHLGK